MKKLILNLGSMKELLTKEEMKKTIGGYTACYYQCDCVCNSGIGPQPSFRIDATCSGGPESFSIDNDSCGCYNILIAAQPGFNSGGCVKLYDA